MIQRLAIVAFVLVAGCTQGPPTPGSGGVAFNIRIPEPIVPETALLPSQSDATTSDIGNIDVQIEGFVWVILREGNVRIIDVLIPESDGTALITEIPPREGYTLQVFGGIPDDEDSLGVIRFASGDIPIDIPPDELTVIDVSLDFCDQIELSSEFLPSCIPDFGLERKPPLPPELFPVPTQTSCLENSTNAYVAAGTKPTDTALMLNDSAAVQDEGIYWSLDLGNEIFQQSSGTLSRSLRTAYLDELTLLSDGIINVSFGLNDSALCFNPYDEDISPLHYEQDDDTVTLRWDPGSRSGTVYVFLERATQTPDSSISASGNALPNRLVELDTDDFGYESITDVTVGEIQFTAPDAQRWAAHLYVESDNLWRLEGTFRFDRNWLNQTGHPGRP